MQTVNSINVKTSLKSRLVSCYHFRKRDLAGSDREPASETSRIDLQKVLASKKFVVLTYGFVPGIPAVVWFSRRTTHDEKQAGMMGEDFFSEVFTHVGQWVTHVDPLAHFHKSLRHG